jgi:protein TonB
MKKYQVNRYRTLLKDESKPDFFHLVHRAQRLQKRHYYHQITAGFILSLLIVSGFLVNSKMHAINDLSRFKRTLPLPSHIPVVVLSNQKEKPEAAPVMKINEDHKNPPLSQKPSQLPPAPKQKPPPTKNIRANTSKPPTSGRFAEARPAKGFPVLYQFFDSALVYPPQVLTDSLEGKVLVSFTINSDGQPMDVVIQESLHPQLDQVALRAVKTMPSWIPARLNGKPVSSRYSLPLYFKITD